MKHVDTWGIRATYKQVQDVVSKKYRLPIKASDNLFNDLGLDADDVDLDLSEEISQRTGKSLDKCETNAYYGKTVTVRDLVVFFNLQPVRNAM